MTYLDTIKSSESATQPSKYSKFIENTKKAVRDTLIKTGIGVSTMVPMATTTTPTVVPASVNTITAISPIASTAVKTISLGAAAQLLSACGSEEGPEEIKDTTPPNINISKSSVDITGGKPIQIIGNQLYIGGEAVASRTDNKSKNCNVSLSLNGKPISSGTTISEEGTLSIKVTDEAGNSKTADIKLNLAKNAPNITVPQYEINIFGGTTVTIKDNQLLFGEEVIASRTDDDLESCKISLKLNGIEIKSGDAINEGGKLTLSITNKYGKSSNAEITLTNDAIYGLENLKNAQMQVDQEINLLDGLTLADGVDLVKTQIEIDAKRSDIDPSHYTPSYPGKCNIIFTLKGKSGNTAEVKVDNLTINALEYNAMQIDNIKPEDILPFLKEITRGDKNIYKHIEHLRIAEATRIRDMMWKYGTTKYTPEQYQELMSRLNTGMLREIPAGYDNYEIIGEKREPSDHAHVERSILNNLINHADFKVLTATYRKDLYTLCKGNPNKINIMGLSMGRYSENKLDRTEEKEYDKQKNRLVFCSGGNICTISGTLKNKIIQEDELPDEHSIYDEGSRAHHKNDNTLDRHLMITIGTDKNGDTDKSNNNFGSFFPVGFHDKVLFAGRYFPTRSYTSGNYGGPTGEYNTSIPNYTNVAMADLCFQMKADIQGVDELLEMMRSTALTDYIRLDLNGDGDTDDNYKGQSETQPLQLINPAGVFKKYLMPTDLPSSLKSDKTISLNKGSYGLVIFDIPGAEVKIDGKWIAYSDANKSLIKKQNPKNLEWRLNGDLCKKMGHKGKTIKGRIIAVDDKWNGLNLDKDFSVTIE